MNKILEVKNFEALKKCGFVCDSNYEWYRNDEYEVTVMNYNSLICFEDVPINEKHIELIIEMTKAGCFDEPVDKGEISDGYHTFNELYYHRMILFATIVNSNINKSWKSWKHEDNTMYDDYFIVGIETTLGQFSYHYHKENWDMFKCKELKNAPKWDGHTSNDVTRLFVIDEPVKTLSDLGWKKTYKNSFSKYDKENSINYFCRAE